MAQIKVLKIASGLPTEHDSVSDDLTLATLTITGGLVASGTGIDMNNDDITDLNLITFTDATTDGITQTAGLLVADNIVGKDRSNVFTTAGDILFPVISDSAGQVDMLRLPALAGVPSATPTATGEGFIVWDSTDNLLYAWDGAAWSSAITTAASATSIDNNYTADTGGVSIRDVVYVSAADKVTPADANAESTSRVIGFATSTQVATATVGVRSAGVLTGFSGLTAGAKYFLSETAGAITATAPTTASAVVVMVGVAKSTTALQIGIKEMLVRAA